MRIKRLICMLLVCATMICGSFTLAGAVQAPGDIIWMEDMEWDLLDPSTVIYDGAAPLTTGSVNTDISPFSTKAISQISLKSGDALTFNCSYSPSSASMDFGVKASSGQFYYINVKGGSISQAIRINQAGSYAVAIRNNSSQTVRVVGFVDY